MINKITQMCCLFLFLFKAYATPQHTPLLSDFFQKTDDPYQSFELNSHAGGITITGSGKFSFLQAFFYNDTACTGLLGSASVVDNVTGYSFSSGDTVFINKNSAYQLANNRGITTSSIKCMKLFLNGGNGSPNGIPCQSFTDETCSGTACTSSQTKSATWGASPTVCATRAIYVVNKSSSTTTKCAVDATTGALSSCAATGSGFLSAQGIAVNNGYAYVVNTGSSGSVQLCSVASGTGALTCSGATGSGFSSPTGIAINNQYVYVVNAGNNTISQCTASPSTGALTCGTPFSDSNLSSPSSIAFYNGYAYITSGNANVSKCPVTPSSGALSACSVINFTYTLRGIAFSNNYAYVTAIGPSIGRVEACTVNSGGDFVTPCSIYTGFNGAAGISISNGSIYVSTAGANAVRKCTINSSTGVLSSCANTGVTTPSSFTSPWGSAIF